MIICVTGTPCTGKSTLAKKITKKIKGKYIDVNKIISKYKLSEGYDKKRKSKIVDIKKLNKVLINIIKKSKNSLVIDSHLSHYLPKKYVDLCIITKCDLKVLQKRLKKRGYNKDKIRENLDAEIFDVCLNEARKKGHNIIVIDTTKGLKSLNLLYNL
jgi:adenylate kinase